MAISNPDLKKLYSLSYGQCNICKTNLFENSVHIGEMAHVIAKKEKGPRGKSGEKNNINNYDNLILLCANHHLEVDQNIAHYTVELLLEIKNNHEQSISLRLAETPSRPNDVLALNYLLRFIPFTRLLYMIDSLPNSINIAFAAIGDTFECIAIDNPHLYPLNDKILQGYIDTFENNYYALWNEISGFSELDNKRQQANFSQADDRGNIYMEKRHLPYNISSELCNRIKKLKNDFNQSYMILLNFLKTNYGEVDLSQFK